MCTPYLKSVNNKTLMDKYKHLIKSVKQNKMKPRVKL